MTSIQSVIESQEDILVTYIEENCLIGQLVKFPKHLLWQIHRVILASLPENRSDTPLDLQPGMHVAVNVEDMFARAVVLEVYSPQHVLVQLLDIGTKELVHTYGIRALSPTLDSFARMAVGIVLRETAAVATGEIRTLTNIEVISFKGEVHLLGSLSPCKAPHKREYARVAAFSMCGDHRQQVVAIRPPTAAIKQVATPSLKPKVPQALTLGSCQIEVIDVPSDRLATVRRADTAQNLRMLEHKLVSFSSKYRPVSSVEVGDYLLALFGGEGHWWSRALVHEVAEDSIQVEYVDYGTYDFIPRANIRELPRCFCQEAAYVASIHVDNKDVQTGNKYAFVITGKLDGQGRIFSGYVTKHIGLAQ